MQTIQKGTILDNIYEIQEQIGSGGGGIVYKAKHLRLNKDVVVKKIRDEALGKLESRQEVDILKNLNNSYLPRVYDFIESEKAVYTVMDYIPGENLSEVLKREGKFPQEKVKKWAKQLGEAIAYLHEQKVSIIHSDIKPANIMLTPEGNICLIDFNVSLAVGENAESSIGVSAGFSPPEQYRSVEMYTKVIQSTFYMNSSAVKKSPIRMDGNSGSKSETWKDMTEEADSEATVILQETVNVKIASNEENEITELLEEKFVNAAGNDIYDEETEILELEYHKAEFGKEDEATEMIEEYFESDSAELYKKDKANGILQEKISDEKSLKLPNEITVMLKENRKNTEYLKYIGRGIDQRADIYSLGATLYVLLTGKRIPQDFSEKIIEKELFPYVSEGFLQVLIKALQANPDSRYQSGKEYLKALNNCKKLDRRYIRMNRTKRGLQLCSFAVGMTGVVLVSLGIQKNAKEQNNAYLTMLQQAEDAIASKDFSQAFSYIDEAKSFKRERIEAYEKELYALYYAGLYEECCQAGKGYINIPEYYVETDSDFVSMGNIYYITGSSCYEIGDYDFARELYEMAIKMNSNNALYYRDYAICLAKKGKSQEAEYQLEVGMSLGLQQDSLYMVKGEIAFSEGRMQESIQNFAECINRTTDTSLRMRAVLASSNVYYQAGNEYLDKEIELLEDYMNQYNEKDNLVIMENLAQVYAKKASVEDEEKYYQKALELFQRIFDNGYVTYQVQENIAVLYENIGELEEAENMLVQLANDYPGRYEVYKRLAYLEADKQQKKENIKRDYSRMKQYYEQAVNLYSDDIQDMEMQMLDNMMNELKKGGWF